MGVGAISVAGAASARTLPVEITGDDLTTLTRDIHAQFGSGFKVCEAQQMDRHTTCLIENRGNVLRVISDNRVDWTVRRASAM